MKRYNVNAYIFLLCEVKWAIAGFRKEKPLSHVSSSQRYRENFLDLSEEVLQGHRRKAIELFSSIMFF